MNLHQLSGPIVGSVNPQIPVSVRVSTGVTSTSPDGSQSPGFATPGQITGSIAGTVLTVSAVASGSILTGVGLADLTAALLPGTTITGQLTGSPGGPGTYSVNQAQTVASEAMTTSLVLLGQVQALSTRDVWQLDGINLQGTLRALYVSGTLNGVVRALLKGGDLVTLPDGTVWLVTMVPEPWGLTAGWTKCVIVLQNGS